MATEENQKPKISNAPEAIDIASWMSRMGNMGGLTRTNRYLVRINPPIGVSQDFTEELIYMCTGGQLPGITMNTLDYRYYGPTKKLPAQTEFNNISFQFLLREKMQERLFFDSWMELIQPQTTFDSNWRREYESTIDIFKYADYAGDGDTAEPVYQISLQQAYPLVVAAIPMQWVDVDVARFQVQFSYSRYFINNDTKGIGGDSSGTQVVLNNAKNSYYSLGSAPISYGGKSDEPGA